MGWKIKFKIPKNPIKKVKQVGNAIGSFVTAVAVGVGAIAGFLSHKDSPVKASDFAKPLTGWCSPVAKLSKPPEYFVIKMKDGSSYGIPSNAIPSNAIPSNVAATYAIPSNAIPSNAIPSNALPASAIPSNFWDHAIPSNALPASALPASALPASLKSGALPASALPASALPASALPASFLKRNPNDIQSLMQEVKNNNALPASVVAQNLLAADLQTGITSENFTQANDLSVQVSNVRLLKGMRNATCQSEPKPFRILDTCAGSNGSCQVYNLKLMVPRESETLSSDETNTSTAQIAGYISVQFYADRYALTQGECTNIHWDATGANKVWVNEAPSDVSGVKQVCPDASKKYQIIAASEDGSQVSSTLDIKVQDAVTESAPGVEVAAPNRCDLFDDADMSVRFLDWQPGASLGLYVKMPGGVPGLEKEIVGDSGEWKYSIEIGSYSSKNCDFIEGYGGRLYCNISVPSDYSNTLRPFSLQVNGCDSPIYSMSLTSIPMVEETASGGSEGGGGSNSSGDGGSDSGQELGCPAGQTYHPPNSVYSGGCCSDGHWFVWPGDPEPGCWNTPSGSE